MAMNKKMKLKKEERETQKTIILDVSIIVGAIIIVIGLGFIFMPSTPLIPLEAFLIIFVYVIILYFAEKNIRENG